jgi:hypothetical protein
MITDEYKRLLQKEHSDPKGWGRTAEHMIPHILKFVDSTGEKTILDYGAGRGGFGMNCPKEYNVIEYEPGRPGLDSPPEPQNFVICVDVLEHVEFDELYHVMADLKRVTVGHGFFQIATTKAIKILSDGRNAHLIVRPYIWWEGLVANYFNILSSKVTRNNCEFFVSADI